MTITVTQTLTQFTTLDAAEDIDNVCITAFEGGVGYWCSHADIPDAAPNNPGRATSERIADALVAGFTVTLRDDADESTVDLTMPKLLDGLVKAATTRGMTIRAFLDDMDAWGADAVVQCAVFGEVVYG